MALTSVRSDTDTNTEADATAGRPAAPAVRQPERGDVPGLAALAIAIIVTGAAHVGPVHAGYVGLDVLFVLVGFLVSRSVLAAMSAGSRAVTAWYAERLRLIVPAVELTVVVTLVAWGVIVGVDAIGPVASDAVWSAGFVADIRFATTHADVLASPVTGSPLTHLWAVSAAVQLGLAWPLILGAPHLAFRRVTGAGRRAMLLAAPVAAVLAASLWWCAHEARSHPTIAVLSPLSRAWEFAAGALVAIALPAVRRVPAALRWPCAYAGLVAIGLAGLRFDDTTTFPGPAAIVPVAGAVAVLAGGSGGRDGLLAPVRWLGARPLRAVGALALALYLWHWPVLVLVAEKHAAPGPGLRLLCVAVAAVLAVLTYVLVQWPAGPARRVVRSPARAATLVAVLVLAGLAMTNAYVVMNQQRLASARSIAAVEAAAARTTIISSEVVAKAIRLAPKIRRMPAVIRPPLLHVRDAGHPTCHSVEELGVGRLCYLGDPRATATVVLFGDAQAGTWAYPLDAIAARGHLRIALFIAPSCPAADVRTGSAVAAAACESWRETATKRIRTMATGLVVVASSADRPLGPTGRTITADEWRAGLASTINAMRAPGRAFQLIGDVPYLRQPGPACVAAHPNDVQACATPRQLAVHWNYRAAEQTLANDSGIRFVDPLPWLCGTTCTPLVGDTLVYKDAHHLTRLYALYLAGSLAKALGLVK